MKTLAAVTTAKGTGAIASIRVAGPSAGEIIKKIFKPTSGKETHFEIGGILTGNILDSNQVIDQVVIGCEEPGNFAINCHGNPIIVEMIMQLLKINGAQLVGAEQFLAAGFADRSENAIDAESKLVRLKAVTLEGVGIIANQPRLGLAGVVSRWLTGIDALTLQDIHTQCEQILADSKIAHLIINGCKVVIAGPANSGKSTLLNCLCGRDKAIVADTAGTTRDWVTGACRTESLLIELVDTAGLDESFSEAGAVDKESQKRAQNLLVGCDLILWVVDGSSQIENRGPEIKNDLRKNAKLLLVLNKLDLGQRLTKRDFDFDFAAGVRISAKTGDGIDGLLERIRRVLGIADFDLNAPVCFTQRQQELLQKLSKAKAKPRVESVITELLNGKVCV